MKWRCITKMVTKEQVKANYGKLINLQDLVMLMVQKHETALFTYRTDGQEKSLPQEDIDAIIDAYKQLKVQLQDKFKELL